MNISNFVWYTMFQRYLVSFLYNTMITASIILITMFIKKSIAKMIMNIEDSYSLDLTLAQAFQQANTILCYALGAILILENLNIALYSVITTFGVIIVGLGFAAQQILAGAIAGIFLLIYKSFAIGDYIICKTPSFEGKIIDINLRNTTLDNKGDHIIIPNQTLYAATVTIRKIDHNSKKIGK